jgi:hypothetical protein
LPKIIVLLGNYISTSWNIVKNKLKSAFFKYYFTLMLLFLIKNRRIFILWLKCRTERLQRWDLERLNLKWPTKKYGWKRGFSAFGGICKWPNLNRPNVQMAESRASGPPRYALVSVHLLCIRPIPTSNC